MQVSIRPVVQADAQAICDIYNHYILHTAITFEQQALGPEAMAQRIADTTRDYPWLVAEREGRLAGYAYATRWRTRAAYDQTVESTIYLAPGASGQGLGRTLYQALLDALRQAGMHAVVGCIALPNPGSIALHEKCGFTHAGHFPQVGRKFDQWVDVGFWQRLL
ncbi:MAG: phosphinothricin acetyltransferase [Paucimonas sp.]|nr:phosphinothricin acetyltransferase [Paucimonas sp.]